MHHFGLGHVARIVHDHIRVNIGSRRGGIVYYNDTIVAEMKVVVAAAIAKVQKEQDGKYNIQRRQEHASDSENGCYPFHFVGFFQLFPLFLFSGFTLWIVVLSKVFDL